MHPSSRQSPCLPPASSASASATHHTHRRRNKNNAEFTTTDKTLRKLLSVSSPNKQGDTVTKHFPSLVRRKEVDVDHVRKNEYRVKPKDERTDH
ncbi:hypothetical protein Pmani_019898 [Petrolisthes manimaculis]|uniref:Uncharacterized protein n=1 Tax=Petrolisthes manimaculis TaxID=1843537 RepID=A0AAE1U540_9EUCA|nr:hypothetical protein Pmani_019898 [Petrolisthes manimaculis]